MATAAKIKCKNAVAKGDYDSIGGDGGYELVDDHEVVMAVPIQWLEEGRALASSEP